MNYRIIRAVGLTLAVILALSLAACDVPGLPRLPGLGQGPTPTAPEPTSTAVPPTPSPVPTFGPLGNEQEAAQAVESRYIAVYDRAGGSVVNITSVQFVMNFFMQPVPQEGSGSGFVYDDQGHIITNYHVVENADELRVTMTGGQVYDATVVGVDPANDLAVIRIDAGDALPLPLPMADSSQLRVGQLVLAIGNPFGLSQTLTTGVISAVGRVIESPEDNRFIGEVIQTDAAINPGNSGGPLLDIQGRVIGVNSQIVSTSGSSAGIGFAVSSNTVQRVVPQLIRNGFYAHPWLGFEAITLSSGLVETLREVGADPGAEQGLLIVEVMNGGPADRAGIRGPNRAVRVGRFQLPVGGDVIRAINGRTVNAVQELLVYLETETRVGDTVQLTVVRDGQAQTVAVEVVAQPMA